MPRLRALWGAAFFTQQIHVPNVDGNSGDLIRMRPGVPWNVKGIEAEAREVAQQAARRAGMSVGEWLTSVIMTDGRGGAPGGYPQSQQQGYVPGDGTFGPQPQFRPQPQAYAEPPRPAPGFPQAPGVYPQQVYPHQAYPQPPVYPQGGPAAMPMPQATFRSGVVQQDPQAYPGFEPPVRSQEITALSGTIRDLGERVEQSERRAQQAIVSVNQSVAAMQERIDAAERVKQLADAAFTSAADALAQSARDQSKAFESLETAVRNVQRRISDIETGESAWPGQETIGRLETALGQMQKRLADLDAQREDLPGRDTIYRLEVTLGQLQKRLIEMEVAAGEAAGKDVIARLEASIAAMREEALEADRRNREESLSRLESSVSSMRQETLEAERRTRDDITQMAKYMRDVGTRVENVERAAASADGMAARFDAFEARSASMFDEIRGQMASMDGRIAQAASGKNSVAPAAFAALKGSVEALASRLEDIREPDATPLVNSICAVEAKLGTLAAKFEESDRRAAESVSGVNAALKSLSSRIEDSDRRQVQGLNQLSLRLDESNERAETNARDLNKSIDDFAQRLDTADKRHKDAMSALRLTVDGLIAKGVADALPLPPYSRGASTVTSALSALQNPPPPPVQSPLQTPLQSLRDLDEPPLPPFLTGQPGPQTRAYSSEPPPLAGDATGDANDGLSLDAIRTMLSTPVPSNTQPFADDESLRAGDALDPAPQDVNEAPAEKPGRDFMSMARRAAQEAAEREAERGQRSKRDLPAAEAPGSRRNFGRLAAIAVVALVIVAAIVWMLVSQPAGPDDVARPDPGSSIGEILNGPTPAETTPATPEGAAEATAPEAFAPVPPSSPETAAPDAAGTEAPAAEGAPAFTTGTSILPPALQKEAALVGLETAAVSGDPKAQFLLSLRYSEGRGVPKDDARAASLASKAAEQGFAMAQYRLGAFYERGVGVEKSIPQAKAWYEKAGKQGNRKAMHNLAVLLADPSTGAPNYKEAARWFREGAIYGLTDSQYNLAVLLEQGMGVEKNLREAVTWYAVAAAQGDTGATERLDLLKKTVPAGEVAVALDTARKFQARPVNPASNEAPAAP